MYRLCAGLAAVGSVANVALPAVGCMTAPRRYTTPAWRAQAGLPVCRLAVLADSHPSASVNGCQVNAFARACGGPAWTGAAAAVVPPITASRTAAGNTSRGDSEARSFKTPPLSHDAEPRPRLAAANNIKAVANLQ